MFNVVAHQQEALMHSSSSVCSLVKQSSVHYFPPAGLRLLANKGLSPRTPSEAYYYYYYYY